MELFIQRVLDGLSAGSIYSLVALALVLVFLATGTVNLAQGSMAMFSALVVWKLISPSGLGWGLAAAIIAGVAVGVVMGAVLERAVVRPVEGTTDHLSMIVVTLGLYLAISAVAGYVFTTQIETIGSPFASGGMRLGSILITYADVGLVIVTLAVSALMALFFRFTRTGLSMRAAVDNPVSAQICGIDRGRMFTISWSLAGGLGAIAAILVAPTTLVSTTMMDNILFVSVAAAALGGFTSPLGAVIGGFLMGLLQSLIPAYVPFIGNVLNLATAFIVLLAILVLRPSGIFGRSLVVRL